MALLKAHYLRVADKIEADIKSGKLKSGDKLPTTAELAEQHNVARATAGRAVRELHARDLVDSQQGQGVYVR